MILTSESPLFDTERCTYNGKPMSIVPWRHQLATVNAMESYECNYQELDGLSAKYRMGIEGDPPGSGKTLSLLMLAFYTSHQSADRNNLWYETKHQNFIDNKVTIAPSNMSTQIVKIHTTIIVVPHRLINQWEQEATTKIGAVKGTDFTTEHSFLKKEVENPDRINEVLSGRYRVVLMTPKAYTVFSRSSLVDMNYNVFERLVFDEADSISDLPNAVFLSAVFVWLLTATYDCHLTLSNQSKAKTKLFNDLFKKLPVIVHRNEDQYRSMHSTAVNNCVIHSAVNFVRESTNVPRIIYRKVPVHPQIARLIEVMPLNNGLRSLMAGNTAFPMVFESIESNTVRERALKTLSPNTCALCLHEFVDPRKLVTLKCCKAQVHEGVLALYKVVCRYSAMCPICEDDTVYDYTLGNIDKMTPIADKVHSWFFEKSTVMSICDLISSRPRASSIVFVNNTAVFKPLVTTYSMQQADEDMGGRTRKLTPLEKELKKRGVTYAIVKGTGHQINEILRRYRAKETSVLIMSSAEQAAGLNLQVPTTHVYCMHAMESDRFIQLVGRGNRYPRTKSLVVYHMQSDEQQLDYAIDDEEGALTDYED